MQVVDEGQRRRVRDAGGGRGSRAQGEGCEQRVRDLGGG